MLDKAVLPAIGFLVMSKAPNECAVVRYWQDPDLLYQASALDEGDHPPSIDADPVLLLMPILFWRKCPLALIKSFLDSNFSL